MPYLMIENTKYFLYKRTLVGRSPGCDLVLPEESKKKGVSREHIEIFPDEKNRWHVQVLTNQEGTTYLVNAQGKQALKHADCLILQDSDDLYLGMFPLTFREQEERINACEPTEIPAAHLIEAFVEKIQDIWAYKERITSFCYSNPQEMAKKLQEILEKSISEPLEIFIKKDRTKAKIAYSLETVIWGARVEIIKQNRKNFQPGQRLFLETILECLRPLVDCVPDMIGESMAIQEIKKIIRQAAVSPLCIMITGETGTGKELIARAIHNNSKRSMEPFYAFNCACFNESLAGSELFGHAKGAFTGADQPKEGLFEAADGGTLFLDEIGDMPFAIQAKMLRVLDNQEIIRIGENVPRSIDVRVVSATNKDLRTLVQHGKFREDLYYRIKGIEITAPPLRERKEDIPLLAQRFLQQEARNQEKSISFAPDALAMLEQYPWPGNVRELKHTIAALVAQCQEKEITNTNLEKFLGIQQPSVKQTSSSCHSKENVSEEDFPSLDISTNLEKYYQSLETFFQKQKTLTRSECTVPFGFKVTRWQIKKLLYWNWLRKSTKEGYYHRGEELGKYYCLGLQCKICLKTNQVNNFDIPLEVLSENPMTIEDIYAIPFQCHTCKKKTMYTKTCQEKQF